MSQLSQFAKYLGSLFAMVYLNAPRSRDSKTLLGILYGHYLARQIGKISCYDVCHNLIGRATLSRFQNATWNHRTRQILYFSLIFTIQLMSQLSQFAKYLGSLFAMVYLNAPRSRDSKTLLGILYGHYLARQIGKISCYDVCHNLIGRATLSRFQNATWNHRTHKILRSSLIFAIQLMSQLSQCVMT